MSYEVTATRRRPQKFEDLAGQEFVASTLKNAIQSGKIAHAYLFSGPRGCGKTSSARILAKALNCQNGPSATPCDECTACQEITKGSSLDVIEIDGASNTSVNDIRQIKDEVLFPPNSCRYKIYIIDEVHMLSTSAFNALLKTIEEPPPYVIFIFATTELHKVPATIKSRCQQFHFRLGTVEQIKKLLSDAAKELNIQADDEALFWIAREATGSFRDAYTLFDQVVAFSEGHITYEKIRDKLGLVGVERLNAICEFCVDGNSKDALEKLDEIIANGVSIEQFISNIADYFRSLLLIKSGIDKEALLGQSIQRFSQKVLSAWNKVMIERALSLMLQLFRDIRYSLSPRYELELSISRLCWLSSFVSSAELKLAIDQAKSLLLTQNPTVTANSISNQTQGMNSSSSPNIAPPKPSSTFHHPFLDSAYQATENSATVNAYEQQNLQSGFTQQESFTQENSFEQDTMNNRFVNSEFVQPENEKPQESFVEEPKIQSNPNLSLEEVKDVAVKESVLKNPLLSSLLLQTQNWIYNNEKLTCTVESVFLQKQILQYQKELNTILSQIWGKPVNISATLLVHEVVQEQVSNPPVVDLICDIFRGSITSTVPTTQKTIQPNEIPNASPFTNNTDSDETEENYFTSEETIGDEDEF